MVAITNHDQPLRLPPYLSVQALTHTVLGCCKQFLAETRSERTLRNTLPTMTHWCLVGNGGMGWLTVIQKKRKLALQHLVEVSHTSPPGPENWCFVKIPKAQRCPEVAEKRVPPCSSPPYRPPPAPGPADWSAAAGWGCGSRCVRYPTPRSPSPDGTVGHPLMETPRSYQQLKRSGKCDSTRRSTHRPRTQKISAP